MRLCWLPVYLAALSPFPSGAGGWLRGGGSMGPCKKLLLNGHPPDGLETSLRRIVPYCKCFRRKCVYVAALQSPKQSPLYWAYRIQDQWHSRSFQDSLDEISEWHIPSLVCWDKSLFEIFDMFFFCVCPIVWKKELHLTQTLIWYKVGGDWLGPVQGHPLVK